EGGREPDRAVRAEVPVRVRDGLTVPVGIQARQRAEDPAAGVRDQNRVVVRVERPVALQEVQQVRHLLHVGRDVRGVPLEVDVAQLEVDDVLDLPVAAELAGRRRTGPTGYVVSCGCKLRPREHGYGNGREHAEDQSPAMHVLPPLSPIAGRGTISYLALP